MPSLASDRFQQLLLSPPPLENSETFLDVYLPTVTGIRVPDWPMCPNHQTPGDFIRAMSDRRPDGRYVHPVVLWISCRAGAKSFNCALSTWATARRYPGHDTRILGGSGEQAKQCYEHSLRFWECQPGMGAEVTGTPHIERTLLRNGSRYSILMCSQASVRGKHPNRLHIDEADEVSPDVFDAAWALGFEKSWGHGAGIPPQWVVTSTINHAGGLVERLMGQADANGWHMGIHCWKEVAETCDELTCEGCNLHHSCRGIMRDHLRECEVVSQVGRWVKVVYEHRGQERRTSIEAAKIDPQRATAYSPGQKLTVRGNPHGYFRLSNLREIHKGFSEEGWDSEMDCNLRQLRGSVLRRADIEQCMADVSWKEGMTTWVGADWGYVNETCELVFQWDGAKDLRVVAEASWTERSDEELRQLSRAIGDRYRTRELWGDAEHAGIFKVLRGDGWDCHKVAFGAHKDQCIEHMRLWMQGNDGRSLKINNRLTHLHDSLIRWHYKPNALTEQIEKKDDHACDAFVAGIKRLTRDPKLKPAYKEVKDGFRLPASVN